MKEIIEKELKRLDQLVDFYIYESPEDATKYMWMREALRRVLKRYGDRNKTETDKKAM